MAIATSNTQLSIPPEETLDIIQGIVEECGLSIDGQSHFVMAVKRAAGIKQLRNLLNDDFMKNYVMPLQGSKLGFRTDKDRDNGYPLNVVRDCAIECLLQGGHLTGNEFNIIAGNTYFTKEFFERKVGEVEGLTDLQLHDGVPQRVGDGALVPYVASWKMNGRPQCLECCEHKLADGTTKLDSRIAVRVNSGMGIDAILGKAKRKMLARIYNQATGSSMWDGEADDAPPALPPTNNLAALTQKLNGTTSTEPDGPTLTTDESQVEDAATDAEASQDPGEIAADQQDAFDSLSAKLDLATSITAVSEIEKAAIAAGLDEKQVRTMCDGRRDEIRESRGK